MRAPKLQTSDSVLKVVCGDNVFSGMLWHFPDPFSCQKAPLVVPSAEVIVTGRHNLKLLAPTIDATTSTANTQLLASAGRDRQRINI